jgi:protein arginine kinase
MLVPREFRGPDAWNRKGQNSDVAISTRVRVARNIWGFPFPLRLDEEAKERLHRKLVEAIEGAGLASDLISLDLADIPEIQRQLLWERNLISREAMKLNGHRGVCWSATQQFSIMTVEEDHLRIQVLRAGLAAPEALHAAFEVDARLDARLNYAWSKDLGFLTACPTNTGTGLRISVMLHVPALVRAGQMEKVNKACAEVGLTVRGHHGEGTKALGDVVQLSNQRTLGSTEEELLTNVQAMTGKVIEYERLMREKLLSESRNMLEDQVFRSLGTLRYARKLNFEETQSLLSTVRLGVHLNLLSGVPLEGLSELQILTQPGHLQALHDKPMDADDRDIARATWLRERFQPESN